MPVKFPCILLLLLSTGLQAQTPPVAEPEPRSINLKMALEPGVTYRGERVMKRYEILQDKRLLKSEAKTPFAFDIEKSNEPRPLMTWKFGRTELTLTDEETPAASLEIARKLIDVVKDLEMKFRCDESGVPEEVANKADCTASFRKAVEVLKTAFAETGVPASVVSRAVQPFEALIAGDAIDAYALQEPATALGMLGAELGVGDVYEGELTLPSPLGGSPIPARQSVRVVRLDEKKGRCHVRMFTTIDPEKAGPVIAAAIEKITGKKIELDRALSSLQIDSKVDWILDTGTGFPVETTSEECRTTMGRGHINIKRYTFQAPAKSK